MAVIVPDHLVYGAPTLEAGVAALHGLVGVRAGPGGQHPGFGTHNALLSLGEGTYLEIISPDPGQPEPSRPRPFRLDELDRPRLVTWAARAPDLDARVDRARRAGFDPGGVLSLGRTRPDGVELRWRMTYRDEPAADGIVPFLIDWADTPHPSLKAPQGCTLVSLRAQHPRADEVRPLLETLEVDLPLETGSPPALIATLRTPHGEVQLR